ncbi:unnamed protein product, partial [Amoebophrya sp. A120]
LNQWHLIGEERDKQAGGSSSSFALPLEVVAKIDGVAGHAVVSSGERGPQGGDISNASEENTDSLNFEPSDPIACLFFRELLECGEDALECCVEVSAHNEPLCDNLKIALTSSCSTDDNATASLFDALKESARRRKVNCFETLTEDSLRADKRAQSMARKFIKSVLSENKRFLLVDLPNGGTTRAAHSFGVKFSETFLRNFAEQQQQAASNAGHRLAENAVGSNVEQTPAENSAQFPVSSSACFPESSCSTSSGAAGRPAFPVTQSIGEVGPSEPSGVFGAEKTTAVPSVEANIASSVFSALASLALCTSASSAACSNTSGRAVSGPAKIEGVVAAGSPPPFSGARTASLVIDHEVHLDLQANSSSPHSQQHCFATSASADQNPEDLFASQDNVETTAPMVLQNATPSWCLTPQDLEKLQ